MLGWVKPPPFRWITPNSLKVATDEKYSHVEELKKMLPDYSKLFVPVIYIHGDEDRLVPFENLAFAKKTIDANCLKLIALAGEDHFLPWTQEELIKEELLTLESKITGNNHQIACSN